MAFLPILSARGANPDAVAYQNDPAHDGAVTFQNFNITPTPLWSVNLGSQVSYPLIAQGEIYVTAGDNFTSHVQLYALNASTGNIDWSVALNGVYRVDSAAYDNGKVFVFNNNSTSSTMNAYNASTGALLWSRPMTGQYLFSSPPTASNGIVYTGGAGTGGTLYAIRETDGALLWTKSVINGDNSSPAVTSTGVYVSYAVSQTFDFNPTTGTQIWHYNPSGDGGGGKTPVYFNGNLYTRDQNVLHAFNASTGAMLGGFNAPITASTAPAFANGMGFIESTGEENATNLPGVLDAFNPATGAILWSQSSGNSGFITAPIVINDVVFEGTSDGYLYEFNDATGALLEITNVGQSILGPDEQNVSQPLTGLGAGDGLLAVPGGTTLTVYSMVPEPSSVLFMCALVPALLCRRQRGSLVTDLESRAGN